MSEHSKRATESDGVVQAAERAVAFAARITGREYSKELTRAEEAEAKEQGLLVIFGASDDLLEFRGAFDDEIGAYEGTTASVHANGVLPSWEALDKDEESVVAAYFAHKAGPLLTVTADWDCDGYSWVISTTAPHATFEVVEDGEKYCRGLVIALHSALSRTA